jgi:hypothetical protein
MARKINPEKVARMACTNDSKNSPVMKPFKTWTIPNINERIMAALQNL